MLHQFQAFQWDILFYLEVIQIQVKQQLLEAAVSAQKRKILPVFIITEMKWNWEHAQTNGSTSKE